MQTGIGRHTHCTWFAGVLVSIILWGLLAPRITAAPAQIDPARSLLVTDRAVLDSGAGQLFSLRRVFDQLIAQSHVPSLTPQALWQQWWDTLRLSPGFGSGPHCDSHTTADGLPGLNGFPIDCPRHEGNEALVSPFAPTGKIFYRLTALVNRFDLTPLSGEHCGEYRMIFFPDCHGWLWQEFPHFRSRTAEPNPRTRPGRLPARGAILGQPEHHR